MLFTCSIHNSRPKGLKINALNLFRRKFSKVKHSGIVTNAANFARLKIIQLEKVLFTRVNELKLTQAGLFSFFFNFKSVGANASESV